MSVLENRIAKLETIVGDENPYEKWSIEELESGIRLFLLDPEAFEQQHPIRSKSNPYGGLSEAELSARIEAHFEEKGDPELIAAWRNRKAS